MTGEGVSESVLLDRFMSKVVWNGDEAECWDWQAAKTASGYGKFSTSHDSWALAHRVSHEMFEGEIPAGLTIDHLCRNRGCVNPAHLEAVTIGENVLRGTAPAALHAKKTHCPAGHPYDEANTYRARNGQRVCRACGRARTKRIREEQR